jgi:CDP-glucose 4,6-dehydratase
VGARLRTVEGLAMIRSAFAGKRVLVTGHTGFKGSWMSLWLAKSGAEVVGYALEPKTERDNFVVSGIGSLLAESVIADIRDADRLREVVETHRPEVVFHLAAQPLVRYSYDNPAETFHTNVVGAANLLDAVRAVGSSKATVVITSDKCYRNNEWEWGYRETDTLGGHDPYSASKAAEELVVSCYRDSFFAQAKMPLASTRAGNVIGGGDWSADRIVCDAIRAFEAGKPLGVRNPASTRPWQHALEPIGGYLLLAARMLAEPGRYTEPFNFGPDPTAVYDVGRLCDMAAAAWGAGASWEQVGHAGGHEAGLLALDSTRARHALGWSPVLSVTDAVEWTVGWYRARFDGADMATFSAGQIADYETLAAATWRAL